MRCMRIMVLAFCLLVLLASGAFANFVHKDVPDDSNAIAFDQRLLLRQAHEEYIWPDVIHSQQQIKAQKSKYDKRCMDSSQPLIYAESTPTGRQ